MIRKSRVRKMRELEILRLRLLTLKWWLLIFEHGVQEQEFSEDSDLDDE